MADDPAQAAADAANAAAQAAGHATAGVAEEVVGEVAAEVAAIDWSVWRAGFAGGDWPQQADVLELCRALHPGTSAVLIGLGLVYLTFGYAIFKYLVTLNAILIGVWLGVLAGNTFEQPVPGAVVGGLLAAALTWPMLRWAVAVLGAALGFAVGVSFWTGTGFEPRYAAAGGLIGAVTLGLTSFIAYRLSVVWFLALQGAVMLVLGLLGTFFQFGATGPAVGDALANQPLILPIALLVPLVFGLMYQRQPAAAAVE